MVMTNTVVGSAIGGLVAGAIALGAAAATRPSPAPSFMEQPAYAMQVANTAAMNNGAVLQCQPYEEAVWQRALVAGREVQAMTCITRATPAPAYYGQPYAQPVYQPVYRDEMVTRPAVRTVNTAPVRRVSTQSRETVRRDSDRSWGKTAMIIGGSSGAGAGVGGLIGGKKGALIGAAIGGGAATIYESTKR
jgi:hypothetical protein